MCSILVCPKTRLRMFDFYARVDANAHGVHKNINGTKGWPWDLKFFFFLN